MFKAYCRLAYPSHQVTWIHQGTRQKFPVRHLISVDRKLAGTYQQEAVLTSQQELACKTIITNYAVLTKFYSFHFLDEKSNKELDFQAIKTKPLNLFQHFDISAILCLFLCTHVLTDTIFSWTEVSQWLLCCKFDIVLLVLWRSDIKYSTQGQLLLMINCWYSTLQEQNHVACSVYAPSILKFKICGLPCFQCTKLWGTVWSPIPFQRVWCDNVLQR